jgi:hypothetical protein
VEISIGTILGTCMLPSSSGIPSSNKSLDFVGKTESCLEVFES